MITVILDNITQMNLKRFRIGMTKNGTIHNMLKRKQGHVDIIINKMKTELTEIQRMERIYETTIDPHQFDVAERYLLKVHDKYGTIDVKIIKEIIK